MPRIFSKKDRENPENEMQKDYYDRHSPHIDCDEQVNSGEKFKVKVVLGDEYLHPNQSDHHIAWIQLWNRETLLCEARFTSDALCQQANHAEIDFYIVAPQVSMNLMAMSYCTKHGLWQSDAKAVKVIHKDS